MKIAIIASHSWPIPTPVHTGDVVVWDLAYALGELGHEVTLFAPEGTAPLPQGTVMPTRASLGAAEPTQGKLEAETWDTYGEQLLGFDVVHDFSIDKLIAEQLWAERVVARRPDAPAFISTPLGGQWGRPDPAVNLCVWSHAMRERGLKGETDYARTPYELMGGPLQQPVKDAHVVYGGVDTDFYSPAEEACDHVCDSMDCARGRHCVHDHDGACGTLPHYRRKVDFLWLNRWHPAKGPDVAIELARRTGIPLVMAGEAPENLRWEAERHYVLRMVALAHGLTNVRFEWLPPDPLHHLAKRDLYRNAKALLYTIAFQEPFGLSQVEAMACGTPVIGIGYGSVPEVVAHGEAGLVVEPGDDAGLEQACADIDVIDPARCRQLAVRRFSRRAMAERYVEQYELVRSGQTWGGE